MRALIALLLVAAAGAAFYSWTATDLPVYEPGSCPSHTASAGEEISPCCAAKARSACCAHETACSASGACCSAESADVYALAATGDVLPAYAVEVKGDKLVCLATGEEFAAGEWVKVPAGK